MDYKSLPCLTVVRLGIIFRVGVGLVGFNTWNTWVGREKGFVVFGSV